MSVGYYNQYSQSAPAHHPCQHAQGPFMPGPHPAPQTQQQMYPAAPGYGCNVPQQQLYAHQSPQVAKKPSRPYTHSPYAQSLCSADNHDTWSQGSGPVYNAGCVTDSMESSSRSVSDDSSEEGFSAPPSVQDYAPAENRPHGCLINITVEVINSSIGKVTTIAGSPHGSSFLQAALRQYPIEAFEIIYKEVAPVMGKLLLDKHACYVVKMVLEMMDKEEAIAHLDALATNEELLLTLCTKDLHSRRMVQFILDFSGADRCRYLFDLVMRRPMQIVRTQQGCITLQRILDHYPAAEKETYFATVRSNFMEYALDPFGNYIIQYMLTEGNQVENSNTLALFCRGQLHNMICHKYASNVIEKCFGLVTPELQHDIIEEMFNAPEPTLMRVLTDSSANYVVQAAIRAASFRDVTLINNRVGAMLPHVHQGRKLQQRLARRLKQ